MDHRQAHFRVLLFVAAVALVTAPVLHAAHGHETDSAIALDGTCAICLSHTPVGTAADPLIGLLKPALSLHHLPATDPSTPADHFAASHESRAPPLTTVL